MIWNLVKRIMLKPLVWIGAGVAAILAMLGLRRKRDHTTLPGGGAFTHKEAAHERERVKDEHRAITEEIKDRHDAARKDVDGWWT